MLPTLALKKIQQQKKPVKTETILTVQAYSGWAHQAHNVTNPTSSLVEIPVLQSSQVWMAFTNLLSSRTFNFKRWQSVYSNALSI